MLASSLLLDGVPGNTENGTDGACHFGDVLMFPRIILMVPFFRIGLAGFVSAIVFFRRDIMHDLSWSSVGASGRLKHRLT